MSFPGLPLTLAELGVLNALPGTVAPMRSIGDIIADVTVEESHEDEMEITQHPVEKTAAITDHAYKQPARCTIRCGFSPAGSNNSGFDFGLGALLGTLNQTQPGGLQETYDKFLQMQRDAELLTVQTGKRTYDNMLIRSLRVDTDVDTENALLLVVGLQEVILVETQTVTVPPDSVQANPKQTGNVTDLGGKSAKPYTPQQVTVTPQAGYAGGGGGGGGGGGW